MKAKKDEFCSECGSLEVNKVCTVGHEKHSHTPTPYQLSPERVHGKERFKAMYFPKWAVEALQGKEHVYIVKCVNAHETLINALKAVMDGYLNLTDKLGYENRDPALIQAAQALKQAEGK